MSELKAVLKVDATPDPRLDCLILQLGWNQIRANEFKLVTTYDLLQASVSYNSRFYRNLLRAVELLLLELE